jgi:hypothetical protein
MALFMEIGQSEWYGERQRTFLPLSRGRRVPKLNCTVPQ